MLIQALYGLIEIFNIITLIILCTKKEYQSGFNILFVMTFVIRGFGQFIISVSESLELALKGYYLVSVGSAFIPMLLLEVAMRVCKVYPNKITKAILRFTSCILLVFSFLVGHNDLYLTNLRIEQINGVTTFKYDYAPMYQIYTAVIFVYMIMFFVTWVNALMKRKHISLATMHIVFILTIATVVCYFLDCKWAFPVSTLSIAHLFSMCFSFSILNSADIHEVNVCAEEVSANHTDIGYLVIDNSNRFINANDYARKIFPEIANLKNDRKITMSPTTFYTEVMGCVFRFQNTHAEEDSGTISAVGDRKYEIKCKDIIFSNNRIQGTFVSIKDVTARENINDMQKVYQSELEAEVREKEGALVRNINQYVQGLAGIIESRDHTTGARIKRTNNVIKVFTDAIREESIGTPKFLKIIQLAAPLHDVGRIAIEDRILKEGEISEENTAVIRNHTTEGAELLKRLFAEAEDRTFAAVSVNIAMSHHENWDGSGYPKGLCKDEIPLEARIVAIPLSLDEYYQMIIRENRISKEEAFEMAAQRIENESGVRFDPELTSIFLKNKEIIRKEYILNV